MSEVYGRKIIRVCVCVCLLNIRMPIGPNISGFFFVFLVYEFVWATSVCPLSARLLFVDWGQRRLGF